MFLTVPEDCPYCFHHGQVFLKHNLQKLVSSLERGAGDSEISYRFGAAQHQLQKLGVCSAHAGYLLDVIECTVLGLPVPDFVPPTRTMGPKERKLYLDSVWSLMFGVRAPSELLSPMTNRRPMLELVA